MLRKKALMSADKPEEKELPVVRAKTIIMAGGEGKRLRPLTDNVPKPLLPIGQKPLLEIIIENLKKDGFKDLIITTGYMDNLIKGYFQEGVAFGVHITYTHEKRPLGTAGPLKLAEKMMDGAFLVVNGDVLTKLNFRSLFSFHLQEKSHMTVAVSTYSIQVPYGVVQTENGQLSRVSEKPKIDFLILAGIYVLNPEILELVPGDSYFDFPHLITAAVENGKKVRYYKIEGDWFDVGRLEDYEHVNNHYHKWI